MIILNSEEFIEKSKDMVVEFYNTMIDFTGEYPLSYEDIGIVFCSCFGNEGKVLLNTQVTANLLFEVTYIKGVFCFDVYNKCSHQEYALD